MSAARMYRTTRHSQLGMTLLEVMIAMTIALFLLAGVMTMLSGTRAAAGTQRQLAQLQDNERLAMTVLTDVIQAAGYFPNPVVNTAGGTLPATATFTSAGQGLVGTSVTAGPDTISVRYATQQSDGSINCVGSSTASATPVQFVNAFSLDAQGNLQCQFNGGAQVTLVSGLTNMRIWYGVNTGTASGQTCADTYLRASEVTTANRWGSVCSVKVELTFTNQANPAKPIKFTRVIAVMNTAGANT
jgi:type IV pilus assembly protein PilW